MPRLRTDCERNHNGYRPPVACAPSQHPCDKCIDRFVLTKAEQIMHNDLHDDPMLVRRVAALIVETLSKRQP